MSDVESDKHENDQEERRPFFGSVRPKMDKNKGVRYSIVHPLTQANFVGIFTLSTIVSYTLVLHLCEQDRYIPPTSFYVWLFLCLFMFWGTLYIEAMPMLFDRIIEISGELLDWAIKILVEMRPVTSLTLLRVALLRLAKKDVPYAPRAARIDGAPPLLKNTLIVSSTTRAL